ncbi:uncharacterized protein BP5553_09075 [Venustampulla echinocandica]|uniref:CENP-V/GFA domain-containing protein n=1 Tax=Venustampulla echinocandica TaxID=2656787 RepID=A0A370TDS6_9HELO|nr:uncharacterized protein BP5553_09075 [Venustampulla echinocandica]RDL32619.1 hypothetical protein BP5553_09075 [Venustampulla echinocandica]
MEATTITATCACKAFTFQADYPNSLLPLPRALCLCTICRRLSGSCGISYIIVPPHQTISPTQYSLTAYKSSDVLTRYFCSTCGAHVLVYVTPKKAWHLSTGTWDRTEGLVKWTGSKALGGTLDGGISVWLKDIVASDSVDGTKSDLKRWMSQDMSGDIQLVPDTAMRALPEPPRKTTKLKAECHCGGVKFYITPPNEASKTVRSPFPDLMVPYHNSTSSAVENPNNETWWLRADDTKYLAGTCTCTSCRRASGFEIQPWAFVPKCNIFKEDGAPLEFNLGTLKQYKSSKGIYREFCSGCGATVFWHCDERPELIDVSVGLLDPEQGARVEGWLEWWPDRVSFSEMAVSKSLVASLEDGLKVWKQKY